jgi:hypothetical protein
MEELCFLRGPYREFISGARLELSSLVRGTLLRGGGVEYLHRDLASRRRRRKGSLESETVK